MSSHAQAETPDPSGTVDAGEVANFTALADKWWDPEGEFAPLHRLNPVRLGYIRDNLGAKFGLAATDIRPLAGLRIADVGCGGGLISEPLARMGAKVTAIDAGAENIGVARQHAETVGLEIDYRHTTAEAMAAAGERFDAVVSMEVMEHVADVELFLRSCGDLLRPSGALLLATLNRTLKSYAMAIVGAEYVLGWLPRGTHQWDKFVRPSELARYLRQNGMTLNDVTGVGYSPVSGDWCESRDTQVNYMAFATKT